MSIFENEDYLPGVVTEIESTYAADYDTSLFGTTDSVVVVGTAFDGPVGVATPVYSKTHAAYLFGKSYEYRQKYNEYKANRMAFEKQAKLRNAYQMTFSNLEEMKNV